MQKYTREHVTEVLAATDIVDVIGGYLELKPAGSRLKALCPFHTEKTPSFVVTRDRQMYHCFGCGKGGDAVGFLMEYEGLSFVEALRKLADRAGIRLPSPSAGGDRGEFLRTHVMELCGFADHYYRETLRKSGQGEAGRQYLQTRKLKNETIERFGVGFSPVGWSNLLDAARKKGFRDDVIEQSGLFKRGERGGYYDFFRGRLMFPIKDVTGRVVAFGGRILEGNEAKYINSSETLIYKKSRVLYGLNEARDATRREKRFLLVEGYFDLLRCFDAGIENVVASCGTALTTEQALLMRRYASEVVVVYDGDAAGIQAALRGVGVLVGAGLHVRAMALPNNQDPDDFVREHGGERFGQLVNEAPDFITFYAAMSRPRLESIEGRATVAREMFSILGAIDDGLRLDEYLKRTARDLGLNEWSCRTEFDKFRRNQERPRAARTEQTQAPFAQDDLEFVAVLLHSEPALERAKCALDGVDLGAGPMAAVLKELFAAQGRRTDLATVLDDTEAKRFYAAAATCEAPLGPAAEVLAEKRLVRMQQDALRLRAGRLQEAIRIAERAKDGKRIMELLAEKIQVDRQLQEKIGAA